MDIHPCPECGEPVTLDTAETCGVCAREMHPHCLARFHDRAACKRPTAYPEAVDDEEFLLSRDLRKAAATLTDREARFLVDAYYQAQDNRIRNGHQIRSADKAEEPHAVLDWFESRAHNIEVSLKGALHTYARERRLGRWCLSIYGIGPVVSAGLVANIDITRAPTVGHIWRFAGLDPTQHWLGKEGAKKLVADVVGKSKPTEAHVQELARRGPFREPTLRRFATIKSGNITKQSLEKALARQPWNASLKRLCWIIGWLFVRLRGSDKDVYGKVYEARKALEVERNGRGDFSELAAQTLRERNFKDSETRARYESGQLPDGRIDLRARRYATKLFLSAYHEAAYFDRYGKLPPKPYVLEHMGHVHYVAPPNMEMIEGWSEARAAMG